MVGTVGKIAIGYLGFFLWAIFRSNGASTPLPTVKQCLSVGGAGCVHCFEYQQSDNDLLSVSMVEPGKIISIPKCRGYRLTSCSELLQVLRVNTNQTIDVDPLNEVQLYLNALKAEIADVPALYNLTGAYQWAVLTHSTQDLKVSYQQNQSIPQLKMYRELVGWSAFLIALGLLYQRKARSNAASILTLSIMVLYLFDIYAAEPAVHHLSFYSSLATAAFIYVVTRQVPIGNILASCLMVLSLVVDYVRANGYASDALLLVFASILVFVSIVFAMVNLDRFSQRSIISLLGLLLFCATNIAGTLFLKDVSLVNRVMFALALNVTPLLLLAQPARSKKAEARAAGRPYRAPKAEEEMEEVEDIEQPGEEEASDEEEIGAETEQTLSATARSRPTNG